VVTAERGIFPAMPSAPSPQATLRVLIVDDEPLARARTRRLLDEIGGATVAGEASSVAEARQLVAAVTPDVVLLDIQMPGEDGFALLEGLEPRPAIVFVTAFDQYAVRAFEEHALDYLLKPFRKERLAEALDRARRDVSKPDDLAQRLAALLATRPLERLTVRVGNRQLILRVDEVTWFGAEDKLVFAATDGDRHWVNFTLDQLEKRLDPQRFFRTHRGAIVNLDFAAALRQGFAGTYALQLKDAARTEVPVSRARARALRDRLGA
jgi:DNA-binding LytR/AlgR family response regulator